MANRRRNERGQFVADTATVLERFVANIEIAPNGCWLWTGYINPKTGYGGFTGLPNEQYAHRASWKLFRGPVPPGLEIDHLCHNDDPFCPGGVCVHRRCVRPTHLEPVTPRVNSLRGKSVSAIHALKTHCAHGHLFDEANTYHRPDDPNSRECRRCRSIHETARQRRNREKG